MALSFNIASGTTAEQLAERRKIARSLLERGGSAAPIGHWTQGLSNALGAFRGGWELRGLEKEDESQRAEGRKLITTALDSVSGATPATASNDPIDLILRNESGGNASARNPNSTATGAGQFIDSTWLAMIRKNRPDLAAGKTPEAILALRTDPALSREMTAAYARENNEALTRGGFEATPGNTYLAHHFGPGGATALLRADPNARAADILGAGVARANPYLANMTAGQLIARINGKMGGPAPQSRGQIALSLAGNQATAPLGNAMVAGILAKEPDKATDDIREYEYARRQGYNKNFADFLMEKRRAAASNVNVDQRGEGAFAKKAGEQQADEFVKISAAGREAQTLQADIGAMKEISSRFATGKMAEFKALLGPYAQMAGINVEGLSDIQAFEALAAKLAPRMRVAGSGATTDRDIELFLKSLPALGRTPQGNAIVTETFEALNAHRQKSAEIADAALAGEIMPAEANKQLRALGDPLTLWRQNQRQTQPPPPAQPNGGAAPAPGQAAPVTIANEAEYNALPPGTAYIGPDGQMRQKTGAPAQPAPQTASPPPAQPAAPVRPGLFEADPNDPVRRFGRWVGDQFRPQPGQVPPPSLPYMGAPPPEGAGLIDAQPPDTPQAPLGPQRSGFRAAVDRQRSRQAAPATAPEGLRGWNKSQLPDGRWIAVLPDTGETWVVHDPSIDRWVEFQRDSD